MHLPLDGAGWKHRDCGNQVTSTVLVIPYLQDYYRSRRPWSLGPGGLERPPGSTNDHLVGAVGAGVLLDCGGACVPKAAGVLSR